jgi:hypothetical protein
MRLVLNPEKFNQFIFEKDESHSTTKEHEMEKVSEYYYNSLLYATDEVLIRMKDFIRDSNEDTFTETAIAMRNDLWGIVIHIRQDVHPTSNPADVAEGPSFCRIMDMANITKPSPVSIINSNKQAGFSPRKQWKSRNPGRIRDFPDNSSGKGPKQAGREDPENHDRRLE